MLIFIKALISLYLNRCVLLFMRINFVYLAQKQIFTQEIL